MAKLTEKTDKTKGFELGKSYLFQSNGALIIPREAARQLNWTPGKTRVKVEIDSVQESLIITKAK